MELKRNSNAVYLLNYHLILITKYRKQVFTNNTIVERTKEIMRKISKENNVEIINQECGLDHIHLMVSTKPTTNLTKYINLLKGHSSRALRKEFDLTDELYGDSFWSDSYYIATAGNVSVDTIYSMFLVIRLQQVYTYCIIQDASLQQVQVYILESFKLSRVYIAIQVQPYTLASSHITFRSHLHVYPYIMYDCIGVIH